jgi:LCP family protein required for cell wall assembly
VWPFKKESDPFASSRYSAIVKSVRVREREHMRYWWQWAVLGFFALIIILAGFGIWRYFKLAGDTACGAGCRTDQLAEGKPFNALLIGSDNRGDLTPEEQELLGARAVGGDRADTLILAHVDPATNRVVMVQFPRDLYVPLYGGGTNKINSALLGGPNDLIRTVKQMTGLKIHHYVQVNIAGFRDIVDAIGGVEICITEPIPFDPQTGIEVTEEEVGLVKFDGDRALRFVRSRNFPTGDFERIQNQQKFVSAALNKATSSGTLFQPQRILRLMDVAGKNLKTDLSPLALRGFLDRLRAFDPQTYEAYTVPNLGTTTNEAGSVVLPDEEAMDILWDAIDANESPAEADGVPDIEPSTVRVAVYNGTFVEGVASTVAEGLRAATESPDGSVEIVEVANADRATYKKTVIRYQPEAKHLAELVAAAMPQAELLEGQTKRGTDVAVVVGEDGYETQELIQLHPIPLPKPEDPPKECRQ